MPIGTNLSRSLPSPQPGSLTTFLGAILLRLRSCRRANGVALDFNRCYQLWWEWQSSLVRAPLLCLAGSSRTGLWVPRDLTPSHAVCCTIWAVCCHCLCADDVPCVRPGSGAAGSTYRGDGEELCVSRCVGCAYGCVPSHSALTGAVRRSDASFGLYAATVLRVEDMLQTDMNVVWSCRIL